MKQQSTLMPRYIFESSWEVCNKVGGIYTVLSSRANILTQEYDDKLIFIGPDIWAESESESPWFEEDLMLHQEWRKHADLTDSLYVRVGRWQVPGNPLAILVNFQQFYAHKNDIYGQMWRLYGVNSLPAYGDYDESCMFAYAVGRVIESFYRYYQLDAYPVAAHFNEWMLGMGALYVKHALPKVATLFTTHATSIGRSIAGNHLLLYKYFDGYNGDQMAQELNMVSKHSLEKSTAHQVDCFTTVSDITARECTQLLDKTPHVVTPNGFEKGFIPQGNAHRTQQQQSRTTMLQVAEALLGYTPSPQSLLIALSGRYEYKNKGIDLFIHALHSLRAHHDLQKEIIAFIMVPAWVKEPRHDLQQRLQDGNPTGSQPLPFPFLTHYLHEPQNDAVVNQLEQYGFTNSPQERVKIIFVPSYLNGDDGVFNTTYYDLLIGLDATVFPSYYEPWGYTPHESIAFSVPTITTSLSGFGAWATSMQAHTIEKGVEVIPRNDDNFDHVSHTIATTLIKLAAMSATDIQQTKEAALALANQADWQHFIDHYRKAYALALKASTSRQSEA